MFSFMPWGLKRFQQARCLHFVTFSCYHRAPLLAIPEARCIFEQALERVRQWYGLYVTGYVVMPEHVHLLISEPERASLAVAIQMLKQIVSYQLHKLAAGGPFWQARYYDFKRYIHRNPVKRGLVESPEQWAWSSFRHYISGVEGMVEIESQWTARKRERLGLALQIIRWDELPRPVSPKPGETKGRAPFEVILPRKPGPARLRWKRCATQRQIKTNIVHAFPQSGSRVGRVLPVAIRPSLELAAHARDAVQIQSESPENCCLRIEEHDGT